jgi:hypothetical protein
MTLRHRKCGVACRDFAELKIFEKMQHLSTSIQKFNAQKISLVKPARLEVQRRIVKAAHYTTVVSDLSASH